MLESQTINKGSHIFLVTVLPANVLSGPWASGPLSIDTKKQNELLRQLRQQAVERMKPYKAKLKEHGYSVTLHVMHGDARASLLKVIAFHKADLVVLYVFLANIQWQAQPQLEEGSWRWCHHVLHCEPLARSSARYQVNSPVLFRELCYSALH